MKLVIAGGRKQVMTDGDVLAVFEVFLHFGVTEVVSGRALGIDQKGEELARVANLPIKPFPYIKKYGRQGGHLRNGQMADYGDALMVFPGGGGTANMLRNMLNRRKPIIVSDDTAGSFFWRSFPGVEELTITFRGDRFKYFEHNVPQPMTFPGWDL